MRPNVGVILAGGLARRMGGTDKPLLHLGGRPLLDHIIGRLAPQCDALILNANGAPERFSNFRLPIVPDPIPDHPGPLAGILAALEWTVHHKPSAEWVVSVSGDTPFLPSDLFQRLCEEFERKRASPVCAASDGRLHPTIALWPVALKDNLRQALMHEELRSVRDWANHHGLTSVSWACDPIDPFFNINTPHDIDAAEAFLKRWPHCACTGQSGFHE